ncbi:MAG: hypothetical protein FJ029_02455 [Actinobacteria bacterium]|nr:hypothetical protein [Actinomycetota bacterium]
MRGDRAKLAQFRWSEEFQTQLVRANLHVDGLGVVPALVGDEIQAQLGRLQRALSA